MQVKPARLQTRPMGSRGMRAWHRMRDIAVVGRSLGGTGRARTGVLACFPAQALRRNRAVLVDEPTEHVVALDLKSGRPVEGGTTGRHTEQPSGLCRRADRLAERTCRPGLRAADLCQRRFHHRPAERASLPQHPVELSCPRPGGDSERHATAVHSNPARSVTTSATITPGVHQVTVLYQSGTGAPTLELQWATRRRLPQRHPGHRPEPWLRPPDQRRELQCRARDLQRHYLLPVLGSRGARGQPGCRPAHREGRRP